MVEQPLKMEAAKGGGAQKDTARRCFRVNSIGGGEKNWPKMAPKLVFLTHGTIERPNLVSPGFPQT